MFSYTATVGRNFSATHPLPGLRNRPMSISAWERFIEDVEADMRAAAETGGLDSITVEIHRGRGEWNGVEEESAKITILTEVPIPFEAKQEMRGYLSQLAREYGQDAIAFTAGQSEYC